MKRVEGLRDVGFLFLLLEGISCYCSHEQEA